ncbi:MAG: class I SAM-dependent methyltransferase [Desulfobacteraceae bacterium]
MGKQKIKLTAEKETLLVPLFSKAIESQKSRHIIFDPKAEDILQKVEYNFKDLKIPRQTLITLAIRAKKLDSYVNDYLLCNDNPLVLHLGCGLDSRFLRVGFDKGMWYDIDYPDVIELRRKFYSETNTYHMIESSVTEQGWLERMPVTSNPACIVAEGLLMYLREDDVKNLFLNLQSRFPGSEIVFDVYSRLTAKGANRHPSIKKTGAYIHWGIDNASLIEDWGTGMQLLDEWYFTDSEDISFLKMRDRILFKTMSLFKVAKRAHRILRIRL